MDPIILTIIIKGILALLLILGGYLQIRYGYKLFANKVGLLPDESAFEIGKIKLQPKSVGSVVMSTAFLWALCSVWAIPNYEQSPEIQKVFSFNKDGIDLEVPVLAAEFKQSSDQQKSVLDAYNKAISKMKSSDSLIAILYNEKHYPVEYGIAKFKIAEGKIIGITQEIKTSRIHAAIDFLAEKKGKSIKFIPKDVKLSIKEKIHD